MKRTQSVFDFSLTPHSVSFRRDESPLSRWEPPSGTAAAWRGVREGQGEGTCGKIKPG